MILLGLLVLVVAVIIGAGVVSMSANTDTAETLVLFGYNFDLTIAGIFLLGAAIGVLGFLGLAMVLGRASGIAHRRREVNHELKATRREAKLARKERDELLEEQRKHAYDTPAAAPTAVAEPAAPVATSSSARHEPVEYETISEPRTQTTDDRAPLTQRSRSDHHGRGFWSRLTGGHRTATPHNT